MRRLLKKAGGAPGVPMLGQSRGITGKRSVRRLIKRDEARGITMPEADSLVKPYLTASLTTALAGANNDLVFTAKKQGLLGNLVSITYVDPGGVSATLGVVVTGNDIVVNLGRAASAINTTATLLKAAIDGAPAAAALVTVANAAGNDGSGLVIALSKTNLSGGYTSIPVAAGAGLGGPTSGAGVSKRSRTTPTNSGKTPVSTPGLSGSIKTR